MAIYKLPSGIYYDDVKNQVVSGPASTTPTQTYTPPVQASAPTQVQQPQSTNVQPPSTNLQPGQSSPDVKQLQDYLVSKGLMTAQQVATGPGIFGPQTQAAVAKLQQQLGVNTGGNDGYYGPLTRQAIQGSTEAQTQQNQQQSTGLDQTAIDGLKQTFGWTDEQIQQQYKENPTEISQWAMVGEYLKKQADLGVATQAANAQAITDAFEKASNDPLIAQKYKELSEFDHQTFQQALNNYQANANTEATNNQMQFENDRKQLAEAAAAKGQAYSGFRNQAQEQLGKTEGGIVESSRRTLQNNLNNLTSSFEQKYGTAATTPATSTFNDPFASSNISLSGQYNPATNANTNLTGTTIGGVTGTVAGQKASDITSRQNEILKGLAPAAIPNT